MHEDDLFEDHVVFVLKFDFDGWSFTADNKHLLVNVFLFKNESSLGDRHFDLIDTFRYVNGRELFNMLDSGVQCLVLSRLRPNDSCLSVSSVLQELADE